MLFQCDVGHMPLDDVLLMAHDTTAATSDVWDFAVELAHGTWAHHDEMDKIIVQYASGWTLDRMANVDRNVMRLALYEIVYRPDIPASVSINEAVELAKEFSTADSGRFVNGILGNMVRDHAILEQASETDAAN